jgi:hypothetical protein
MKVKLLLISILLLASASAASAQETGITSDPQTAEVQVSIPGADIEPSLPAKKQTPYVRPSAAERRSKYVKGMFGWSAIGRNVAGAGISTWRNTPREWGGQWKGFGKRVASNFGKRVIGESVKYGLDEALEVDSSFYKSENRSTGARIKNALLSTVTARKSDGRRVVGVPRLVGTYSSHIIAAETWYPFRYSYKDGLRSGTISLGVGTLFNLVREFVSR